MREVRSAPHNLLFPPSDALRGAAARRMGLMQLTIAQFLQGPPLHPAASPLCTHIFTATSLRLQGTTRLAKKTRGKPRALLQGTARSGMRLHAQKRSRQQRDRLFGFTTASASSKLLSVAACCALGPLLPPRFLPTPRSSSGRPFRCGLGIRALLAAVFLGVCSSSKNCDNAHVRTRYGF